MLYCDLFKNSKFNVCQNIDLHTHIHTETNMPCFIALHLYIYIYIYIYISGGPLLALTCCVNVRLLSGDKKNIAVNLFSKLGWELGLYYASYDDFHPDILAQMYT